MSKKFVIVVTGLVVLIVAASLLCSFFGESYEKAPYVSLNCFGLGNTSTPYAVDAWYNQSESNRNMFDTNINFSESHWSDGVDGSIIKANKVWRNITLPTLAQQTSDAYYNSSSIIGSTISVYAPSATNYSEGWDPSTEYEVDVVIPTKSWSQMTDDEKAAAKELAVALYWNANRKYIEAPHVGYVSIGGFSFESPGVANSNNVYREDGISIRSNGEEYFEEYRHPTYEAPGIVGSIMNRFMDPHMGTRLYYNSSMEKAIQDVAKNSDVSKEGIPSSNWSKNLESTNIDNYGESDTYSLSASEKYTFSGCKEYIESGFEGLNDTISKVEFKNNNGYISVDIELNIKVQRAIKYIKEFRDDAQTKNFEVKFINVSFDLYNNGFYRDFTYHERWGGYKVMADCDSVAFKSYLFFYNEQDCNISTRVSKWQNAKALSTDYAAA